MLLDNLDNNKLSVSLFVPPSFPVSMLDVVQSHSGVLSYWLVEFFGGKYLSKIFLDRGSIEGLSTDGGGGTCCV